MNILIVSHVAHIRNHLAVYLMLQDAIQDVHAVTSTQDVYAMLDAYSFDLLIVDLDLPGKTGFALVQHVHDTVMRINLLLLGLYITPNMVAMAEATDGLCVAKSAGIEPIMTAIHTFMEQQETSHE